jgi:peptidyl-prolyl cis-trans isomerase A (cyclophilin A)
MTDLIDRRGMLAGAAALASIAGAARSQSALPHVILKTTKGAITLELEAAKAPITVRNFLRYVDMKRFDKSDFYRVSHAPNQPEFGLIEGGLRGAPSKVFKPIPHESTLKTGLTHKDGVISMARRAPGTATADFFIVVGNQSGFDADPMSDGDKDGFAAFGQVVDGMDVVRAIFNQPVSATAGVGAMRGEMLKAPVVIISARRSA